MQALQFTTSIPRYALSKVAGGLHPSFYIGPLSCLHYRNVPEPSLPGPDWVRIKTRYAGICGSDLGVLRLHASPLLSCFTSNTFTLGHEQVGTIAEVGANVNDLAIGQRVTADPVLPCATRGIDPPCTACQAGEYSRCRNFAEGQLAPGMMIGLCEDTGGSWSESFVAHRFQVFPIPDAVSDENAILIDAFCAALHPVTRCFPDDDETVLIIGAGSIGICAVAALRALGSKARVIVLARYRFQGEAAERFGADRVVYLRQGDHLSKLANLLGGKLYQPVLGNRMMMGGADVTYECVGVDSSIDQALRLTRSGGRVALLGLAGTTQKVDWTPVWFNELYVQGSFASASVEQTPDGRRRAYQQALEWMGSGKLQLAPLLTHTFQLSDYRKALRTAFQKGRYGLIKSAFVPD